MTKIIIRTLLVLDAQAIIQEGQKLNKTVLQGDNDGITNIFFITPDLTTGQKNVMQALIDKIGTGSIS